MLLRSLLSLAAVSSLVVTAGATAQTSIRTVPDRQQWVLTAGESSYVVGVNEANMMQTLYWGPALAAGASLPRAHSNRERASQDPAANTTPLEYPAWGGGLVLEPALKVDSPNGDRTLVLVYDHANVNGSTLELVLKDKVQPVLVHLFYQVFPQGVMARWSSVENQGKKAVELEQAASATYNLPAGTDYNLSWLTGQWAGEFQLHTEPLENGERVMESRRGSTGAQSNPWFALGEEHRTTESDGPVWFGQLGWSGSWRISVEHTSQDLVRITGGYNPYDFNWELKPGEHLDTPKFYAGYTSHGNGEASRILHSFQREEILPYHPNEKPRPVIYNSWEATEFNVSEAGQIAQAEKAAALGVERFVMDDGWFGQRKDDHAGLGDWYVNKEKFPNGLKPLIDRVHALGMDFGIWVEPEMVNPDSDLYRKHPDWAMHFPDRQRTEARNQLMLNLAQPEVKAYVFGFLDKLVSENDVAFLKWDYNRVWSEPGWAEAGGTAQQKEIYVRYVQNLYDILRELRAKHPKLEIESCSSGGGRVDLGILQYTDETWPSDNTDALDRLSIQDGYTHAYAPQTMAAWVTDVPSMDRRSEPLSFRFLVAMQGALGVGNNLTKFTQADMDLAKEMVTFYKTVRTTVQQGRLYRLRQPETHNDPQVEYVSADGSQAVLFAYLHAQRYMTAVPAIRLQGLDPNATYRIVPLDARKYAGETEVSGSVLMGDGVRLRLGGDYDATALRIERLQR